MDFGELEGSSRANRTGRWLYLIISASMNGNELYSIHEQPRQFDSASLSVSEQCRGQQLDSSSESPADSNLDSDSKYELKELEPRRRDPEKQRQYRAQQTPEKKNLNKETDSKKKCISRSNQQPKTPEEHEKKKEVNRAIQREWRAKQTPAIKEQKKVINREQQRKSRALQSLDECEQTKRTAAETTRSTSVISEEELITVENNSDIAKYQRNRQELFNDAAKMLSSESLTNNTCAVCDRRIVKNKTSLHSITPILIHVSLRISLCSPN